MEAMSEGLVVRNTFLDFPEDPPYLEEAGASRRPRAVSDLTDTKLPWKVPLHEDGGFYQIARHRLTSEDQGHPNEDHSPGSPARLHDMDLLDVKENMDGDLNRHHMFKAATPIFPVIEDHPKGLAVAEQGGQTEMLLPGHFPAAAPMPLQCDIASYGRTPGAGYGQWWNHGAVPGQPLPAATGYQNAVANPQMLPLWGQSLPYQTVPQQQSTRKTRQENAPLAQAPKPESKKERGTGRNRRGRDANPLSLPTDAKAAAPAPLAKVTSHHRSPGAAPARVVQDCAAGVTSKGHAAEGTTEPTTVMMRNIPNKHTSASTLELLDKHGFQGLYDFVYLPIDFQNTVNLGYAFVNLLTHEHALRFKEVFQGFSSWEFESTKICEISWAHPNQGLHEHVERYRNSPVMHPSTPEAFKPMVFRGGVRVPFPEPTRPIKAPKLRNSRAEPT